MINVRALKSVRTPWEKAGSMFDKLCEELGETGRGSWGHLGVVS